VIIFGIDPGLATTGYGIIKKEKGTLRALDYGIIETSSKQTSGQRLQKIYHELSDLLTAFAPNIVAVERLYFFKNLKTALPVSEARGVILLACSQQNLKIQEFTPLQVKTGVCGYGRAEKQQIQKIAQKILKMAELPKPDDAADALALAICCSYAI